MNLKGYQSLTKFYLERGRNSEKFSVVPHSTPDEVFIHKPDVLNDALDCGYFGNTPTYVPSTKEEFDDYIAMILISSVMLMDRVCESGEGITFASRNSTSLLLLLLHLTINIFMSQVI